TFEGSHRNQVYDDALAVRSLGELGNRPFQPALFFSAVGNADLHLRTTRQQIAGGLAGLVERFTSHKYVIGSRDARDDKQDYEQLAQQREFGTFRVWSHGLVRVRLKER